MRLENRHERRGHSAEILWQAKANRIKLEIELHKAKKGSGTVLTDSAGENPAVTQMPEDAELRALLEGGRG